MSDLDIGVFLKDGSSYTVQGTVEEELSLDELSKAGLDVNNIASLTYNSSHVSVEDSLESEVKCIDIASTSLKSIPVTNYYKSQVQDIASSGVSTQRSYNKLSSLSPDSIQTAAALQNASEDETLSDKLDDIVMNPVDPFYDDFVTSAKSNKKLTS